MSTIIILSNHDTLSVCLNTRICTAVFIPYVAFRDHTSHPWVRVGTTMAFPSLCCHFWWRSNSHLHFPVLVPITTNHYTKILHLLHLLHTNFYIAYHMLPSNPHPSCLQQACVHTHFPTYSFLVNLCCKVSSVSASITRSSANCNTPKCPIVNHTPP